MTVLLTPNHDLPYPQGDENGFPPEDFEALADRLEVILNRITPLVSDAADPDPAELIIVDGSSVPQYVALSGDATITDAGVLTLINNAVTAAKIAAGAVTSSKIGDGQVTAAKLAVDAVEAVAVAANAIAASELADNAVDTAAIQDLAVTTAKIAADAINGTKIADNSIGNEHLQDNSVTPAEMDLDGFTAQTDTTRGTPVDITKGTNQDVLTGVDPEAGTHMIDASAHVRVVANAGATARIRLRLLRSSDNVVLATGPQVDSDSIPVEGRFEVSYKGLLALAGDVFKLNVQSVDSPTGAATVEVLNAQIAGLRFET